MSIRVDIKRTLFYKELSEEKREEYFKVKRHKILPVIDNIYYNVYLKEDYTNNPKLKPLIEELQNLKEVSKGRYEAVRYNNKLDILPMGIQNYKYCLCNRDLYDIFITDNLVNENNPRIQVQIRAYGLWTRSIEEMLGESYKDIESILKIYDMQIKQCMENRIDYAYHNNAIQNLNTNLEKYKKVGDTRSKKFYHETKVDLTQEYSYFLLK